MLVSSFIYIQRTARIHRIFVFAFRLRSCLEVPWHASAEQNEREEEREGKQSSSRESSDVPSPALIYAMHRYCFLYSISFLWSAFLHPFPIRNAFDTPWNTKLDCLSPSPTPFLPRLLPLRQSFFLQPSSFLTRALRLSFATPFARNKEDFSLCLQRLLFCPFSFFDSFSLLCLLFRHIQRQS